MIKIICVGKLKEKYLIDMVQDYLKRVNKYHKVEIIELKDSNISDEEKLIIDKINKKSFIVTLEVNGKNLSSEELSNNIDKWLMIYSDIIFIIGGSNGLGKSVLDISNYRLSFGNNTFPHGMFRAILLEQIYRSFKILNNETYHK